MPSDKQRIDVLLVERGIYESREKAKAAIMAGLVFVDGERWEKAGTKLDPKAEIVVKGAPHPYVSRGGLKLEKALREFAIVLNDVVMIDIGASTGGFTDCALRAGASLVYAVDVGYNQLAWSIRNDPRVRVMERTNFRHLTAEFLDGPPPRFASIDVSFISLRLILPPLLHILAPDGEVVALIKPQFEAGREQVGKSGVVRDPAVHRQVLTTVLQFAGSIGFRIHGLTFSPIRGGEGNIEFLVHWRLDDVENSAASGQLEQIIEEVLKQTKQWAETP